MNKIKQLDTNTANKIAAGEVVERPMNVVKELVENSLDAHAKHIQIELENGGLTSIKITDDGEGMSYVDAKMCFLRHATSKIENGHDLFQIGTLGFRGEAIPSISAISHFDLWTSNNEESTRIIVEYGKQLEIKPEDRKQGTTITITKLFQNVPARLKYMKAPTTEFASIYSFVEKLALSNPQVSFRFIHNGKQVFQTSGNNQLLEVISQIYGIQNAKKMLYSKIETDEMIIDGYLSDETLSRSSKSHIITFINKRYIKSKLITDTIDHYYQNYLKEKRHPICIINIDMDPYLVDVNVHPAKMEVRFSNEEEIQKQIIRLCDQIFIKQTPIYEKEVKKNIDYIVSKPIEKEISNQEIIKDEKIDYSVDIDIPVIKPQEEIQTFDFTYQEEKKKPILNKVYVLAKTQDDYLLAENERGLYIVSIKRAYERVYFDYYQEIYRKGNHHYQTIVPFYLEFTESEALFIKEKQAIFQYLGIHLELSDKSSFIVREIPIWMVDLDVNDFIEEMIQKVLQNKLDLVELEKQAIYYLLALKIKKLKLTQLEMQALMDDLMRQNVMHTPYGEPIYRLLTKQDIEKLI